MPVLRGRPEQIALPNVARTARRRGLFARAPSEPLRAQNVEGGTLLKIYGPIASDARDGVTAEQFASELPDSGDIVVKVHSPGGSVFDGVAIYNALVSHKGHVRIEIPALAASAASVIAMAGDVVAVAPSAHVMVHKSWSFVSGPAEDMRAEAKILDSIDRALVGVYHRRTGISVAELETLLSAETWLLGQQAIAKGFADELLPASGPKVAAKFDLSVYDRVPDSLAKRPNADVKSARIESRAHLERELRVKLGLAHAAAKKVASAGFAALVGGPQTEIEELSARIAQADAELQTRIRNEH